jgi:hypothetical protein
VLRRPLQAGCEEEGSAVERVGFIDWLRCEVDFDVCVAFVECLATDLGAFDSDVGAALAFVDEVALACTGSNG